jgi:hypothetical protein
MTGSDDSDNKRNKDNNGNDHHISGSGELQLIDFKLNIFCIGGVVILVSF